MTNIRYATVLWDKDIVAAEPEKLMTHKPYCMWASNLDQCPEVQIQIIIPKILPCQFSPVNLFFVAFLENRPKKECGTQTRV